MERGRVKLQGLLAGHCPPIRTAKAINTGIVSVALAGLLALAAFGPGRAPAQGLPNPYKVYVACGLGASAKPAHSCARGAKKAAFFRSKSADVHYKICVRFPTGLRLCAPRQPAPAGTLHSNRITSTIPGIHKVTWYVKGHQVGVRYLRVRR
jgi:hypothetical protein